MSDEGQVHYLRAGEPVEADATGMVGSWGFPTYGAGADPGHAEDDRSVMRLT